MGPPKDAVRGAICDFGLEGDLCDWERAFSEMYKRLHELAQGYMARERRGHTLHQLRSSTRRIFALRKPRGDRGAIVVSLWPSLPP